MENSLNWEMVRHCVIILSIASRASHATYSTTRSFAQKSHGYDRDRMPKKETTSSDCRGVGLSGYVAAIVCNRFHVDRPSSSLSSGQPCLNRPFSLSGTGFAASSVFCIHSSEELKRETTLENSSPLIKSQNNIFVMNFVGQRNFTCCFGVRRCCFAHVLKSTHVRHGFCSLFELVSIVGILFFCDEFATKEIGYSRIISKHWNLLNRFRGYCSFIWQKCQSVALKLTAIWFLYFPFSSVVATAIFARYSAPKPILLIQCRQANLKNLTKRVPNVVQFDFVFPFRIYYRKICILVIHSPQIVPKNVSFIFHL